jgi:hypothetical protein
VSRRRPKVETAAEWRERMAGQTPAQRTALIRECVRNMVSWWIERDGIEAGELADALDGAVQDLRRPKPRSGR